MSDGKLVDQNKAWGKINMTTQDKIKSLEAEKANIEKLRISQNKYYDSEIERIDKHIQGELDWYWTRELLHSGTAFTYDSLRDALAQDKKFQRQRKKKWLGKIRNIIEQG